MDFWSVTNNVNTLSTNHVYTIPAPFVPLPKPLWTGLSGPNLKYSTETHAPRVPVYGMTDRQSARDGDMKI